GDRADDAHGEHTHGGEPGDPPAVGAARGQGRAEHHQHDRAEAELEDEPAHGVTIRARSGTVAVSTSAIATARTPPQSTSTAPSRRSATHAGPRASTRSWKWGEGGPQKICLTTRST